MVLIEWLALAIELEQRLLEALEEGLLLDIGARIVNEDAGLNVARGVDVAVDPAASHAAAGKLAVVLEIDAVELFSARDPANLAHAVLHINPLLGAQKKRRVRVLPDGHIVEVPRKDTALGDEKIQKFVARDDLVVSARVADGNAERDTVAAHEVHGGKRPLEVSVSATAVVCFLEALDAHGDKEVSDAEHLLAELVVDQRAVREGVEGNIAVLFAKPDDVFFAHQGLAAGKQARVRAERLGLGERLVHFLEREALLVAVFRRPAAGTVHVARGGRVHQNEPRDVDIVFCRGFLRDMIAPDAALVDGVREEGFENVGVVIPQQPLGIVRPFAVRVICDHAKRLEGLLAPHVAMQPLHHGDQIGSDLRRVLRLSLFDEVIQQRLKRFAFGSVRNFIGKRHKSRPFVVKPVVFVLTGSV